MAIRGALVGGAHQCYHRSTGDEGGMAAALIATIQQPKLSGAREQITLPAAQLRIRRKD